MTAPRFAYEHDILVKVAERLLAERKERWNAAVTAGTITREKADEGIRITSAVVQQWRAVVDRADVPDWCSTWAAFGAGESEMRATLDAAQLRAAKIADATPGNRDKADHADALAALAWHQRRASPGTQTPAILLFHAVHQKIRAEIAAERSKAA